MYMTARRLEVEGKPVLKLNIHEYTEADVPFLDSLGIDEHDDKFDNCRFLLIHSQNEFLRVRSAIIKQYDVEEKGPRVFLKVK